MPICGMWDYKARGILKTRLLCTLQPSIRRGLKFGSSICELLTFSVSCFDWSTLYQIYSCLIHNGAEKDTHTSDLMFFFFFLSSFLSFIIAVCKLVLKAESPSLHYLAYLYPFSGRYFFFSLL